MCIAALAAAAPARALEEDPPDGTAHLATRLPPPERPGLREGPAAAARAWLASRSGDVGLVGAELTLEVSPPPGVAGAVRFRRSIAGLPVLNGSVHVALDAAGAVRGLRAGGGASSTSGRFALDGGAAARAAAAALGGTAPLRRGPVVRPGWWAVGGVARAVYEVEHASEEPEGEWRSTVDAETGRVLFREDLRLHASASGRVYALSPVEQAGGLACPLTRAGYHEACASTDVVALPDLASERDLTGSHVTVYDCRGTDYPTGRGSTAACVQAAHPVVQPGAAPVYDGPPDLTGALATDAFASVMAYYQLDRHFTFLQGLDPALAAELQPVPAFVNAYSGGRPYDNAHYSSSLKGVVLGQGASADFAYDASVAFHELNHAAVDARGGFQAGLDSFGALEEPNAVNEGTADSLAAAHTGTSQIGRYVASYDLQQPFLRDLDNQLTCQGSGVRDASTYVDGLIGEAHADGEIWNGFYWEVAQGLAGVRACGGSCDAAAAIQAVAMGLAAGGSPTLRGYAEDMVQAARVVLPERPDVADYVGCVSARRGMDQCDRAFRLYAGESKAQVVQRGYGSFQYLVQTSGPAVLEVCSVGGTSARARVRKSQPVRLSFSLSGEIKVAADASVSLSRPCSSSVPWETVQLPGAGAWYLLIEAPGAVAPKGDVFAVHARASGFAERPAAASPAACALGGGPVPAAASSAAASTSGDPAGGASSAPARGDPGRGGGCGHGAAGLASTALPLLLARRRRWSARPGALR